MKCQGFSYACLSTFSTHISKKGNLWGQGRKRFCLLHPPSSREESMPEYQQHIATLSPRALTMLLPESHGNLGDGQDSAAPCSQTSDWQKTITPPPQCLRPLKWPLPPLMMAVLFLLDGRMKVGDMRGFLAATSISCSSWIVPGSYHYFASKEWGDMMKLPHKVRGASVPPLFLGIACLTVFFKHINSDTNNLCISKSLILAGNETDILNISLESVCCY